MPFYRISNLGYLNFAGIREVSLFEQKLKKIVFSTTDWKQHICTNIVSWPEFQWICGSMTNGTKRYGMFQSYTKTIQSIPIKATVNAN